eukprot:TRINITY_DN7088_c0_g2_i2.p1 TRINITY_DN7088_c0_g2~~TRINITY_DN7088_c0_g2_i2.p1  ORF type:complete len:571 (+),score=129.03 TRINITY_DN7088_c0_g2_i2:100-1713(+)
MPLWPPPAVVDWEEGSEGSSAYCSPERDIIGNSAPLLAQPPSPSGLQGLTLPRRRRRQGTGTRSGRGTRAVPPRYFVWDQLTAPDAPAPRGRHSVGIDEQRGLMLVFGGQNYDLRRKYSSVSLFDLNAERWVATDEDFPGPCARSSHASVSSQGSLVVFGGATGASLVSCLPGCCHNAGAWRFAVGECEWSRIEIPGLDEVAARYGHTAVLAPGRKVYLFGGMTDHGCDCHTHCIDLEAKVLRRLECVFRGTAGDVCGPLPDHPGQPTAQPPQPQNAPSATTTGSGALAHAATQGSSAQSQPQQQQQPLQRQPCPPGAEHVSAQQVRECVRGFGHTAVYNPRTHSMYVLGGTVDGRSYSSNFLRLDLAAGVWQIEPARNRAPQGRYVHCAAYDPTADAMYVFGGYCGVYKNDVFEYQFGSQAWRQIRIHPASPAPQMRSGACCVVWRDHLYVCGGCDDTRYYNDVWKMRLWNETSLTDTIVDSIAWFEATGRMDEVNRESIPPGLSARLQRSREYYRPYADPRMQIGDARRGMEMRM